MSRLTRREPQVAQMRGQRIADRHELVDVLEQPGLLAAQRDCVHGRLGQRAAAAQAQSRARVVAGGSGSMAPRPGRRCRSRRTAGSCGDGAACGRRPPGPRRAPASRTADGGCGRGRPARRAGARAEATSPGSSPPASRPAAARPRAQPLARALEHLDLMAAPGEQRGQVGDRALLPAGRSVAVVEDQDHARGRLSRRAGALHEHRGARGGRDRAAPTPGRRSAPRVSRQSRRARSGPRGSRRRVGSRSASRSPGSRSADRLPQVADDVDLADTAPGRPARSTGRPRR